MEHQAKGECQQKSLDEHVYMFHYHLAIAEHLLLTTAQLRGSSKMPMHMIQPI